MYIVTVTVWTFLSGYSCALLMKGAYQSTCLSFQWEIRYCSFKGRFITNSVAILSKHSSFFQFMNGIQLGNKVVCYFPSMCRGTDGTSISVNLNIWLTENSLGKSDFLYDCYGNQTSFVYKNQAKISVRWIVLYERLASLIGMNQR